MYKIWLAVNGAEVLFKTDTAANKGSAVIQARRAYPDGVVQSVVPA